MSTIISHSLLPVLYFTQTYFSSFRKILPIGHLNWTFKSCFTQYSLWKPLLILKTKRKKKKPTALGNELTPSHLTMSLTLDGWLNFSPSLSFLHCKTGKIAGNSLAVQWLGLSAGWGTKIPQATRWSQKIKKKKKNGEEKSTFLIRSLQE